MLNSTKMTETNINDNKTPLLSDLTDLEDLNDQNSINQSACQIIVNPIITTVIRSNNINQKLLKSNYDNQLLPSNKNLSKQLSNNRSTKFRYQTFNNQFNSPLKRSSTFAGVFGSFLNKQTDPILNQKFNSNKESNNLCQSKFNYDNRFISSEPLPNINEFNKQLITSSTYNLPNLIDLQSIKQSFVSIAVGMTKHQFSNTGHVLEHQQHYQSNKALKILNSLSNSTSTLSTSNSPSSYTNNDGSTMVVLQEDLPSLNLNYCTLCLQYIDSNEFILLENCKCGFCRSCLEQYCKIIIREHSLISSQIACPSADCPNQNNYLTPEQIKDLVDESTFKLYEKIKLDLEVHLDPNRLWCPRPNCESICTVSATDLNNLNDSDINRAQLNDQKINRRLPVTCKKCNLKFCLHCRKDYHGILPCQSESEDESLSLLISRTRTPNSLNEYIKKCPQCGIYIERDRGCAQMMCQKCKHVFCWFCLSSLEEDFLLRHYDSGACKNKLGHSNFTLLWLRFQVMAVFLGFAIFLLLLSPILLIAVPILLIAHYFCNVSISTKIWTKEDFQDVSDQLDLETNPKKINNNDNQNNLQNSSTQNATSDQIDHLIDLNTPEHQVNIEINPIETESKHQKLIQAYLQSNNGVHQKLIDLSINDFNKFDDHPSPIKLSGYDRTEIIEEKKTFFSSWLNWFNRNQNKPDPPPRLSSMLDVEKHRKFIEELMADRLSLDNQLNSVDIDKHYMIINRSEIDNEINVKKENNKWWKFKRSKKNLNNSV